MSLDILKNESVILRLPVDRDTPLAWTDNTLFWAGPQATVRGCRSATRSDAGHPFFLAAFLAAFFAVFFFVVAFLVACFLAGFFFEPPAAARSASIARA